MQRSLPALGLILMVAAGCNPPTVSDTDPADSPVVPSLASVGGGLVPLDPFGVGVTGPGVRGCRAPGYHQFDFWLGTWDVFAPAGQLAGTSLIEPAVDDCGLVENWTSAPGFQGKSLNSYDAATGRWHQMWVSDDGCPFSVILMEGSLVGPSIDLVGRREQPQGFLIGPPCAPPPPIVVSARTDAFRWTPIPGGQVLQQISGANDDAPLPPHPDPSTLLGLRYVPVATRSPTPPAPARSFCPFRAAMRRFDFLLGTWRVHRGEGQGGQGRAEVVTTMQSCLIEERLSGPGGYQGIAFSTFDVFTQRWVRTWIDNAGQRLFLQGNQVDGRMVLEGVRRSGSGDEVRVRVTWDPIGPGEVIQRWEYSRDGGATWGNAQEVRFDSVTE